MGSSFSDFMKGEGLHAEAIAVAIKRVLAWASGPIGHLSPLREAAPRAILLVHQQMKWLGNPIRTMAKIREYATLYCGETAIDRFLSRLE